MTPMMVDSFENSAPGMRQLMENYSLMVRMGEPEEVADAVLWLKSRASPYINGTSFAVDGGHLAGTHGPAKWTCSVSAGWAPKPISMAFLA
ncbi:Enoyl-(Acyl carrier protein) reductase [Sphingobium sp. YR768]|nr:Enoyl-(Acyl carrier protein) reductase [Sphingobium sp. YR768]